VIIADANKEQILAKTNNSPLAEAIQLDITNDPDRSRLIQQATIVISMMPPSLHYLIAKDCVEYGKNLLTASYLDEATRGLQTAVERKGLLFICEMGLDPGIDHMSAMKIIDTIRLNGGTVTSFKSHCGGLVAQDSDDNPWHYKISWNREMW
jgi:saccharopine dehydrogenase-like NADP-dependent oxidoreductase